MNPGLVASTLDVAANAGIHHNYKKMKTNAGCIKTEEF